MSGWRQIVERPPRLLLVAATATGMLLAAIDYSIVGTAMPTVVSALGGLSLFSWVFALYSLVSTTFIPIFGRLSDLFGRKRLYLGGLAIFVVASALCGLAQTMPQLIAFRGLQGLGAAAIFGLTFAIIGDLYPPERRGAAQSATATVWVIAAIVGPGLGAALVETAGWRAVFLVNLPISLIPLTALGLLLRDPPRPRRRVQIDVAGAVTMALGIAALLIALPRGEGRGWDHPLTIVLLVAAAALLALFVRIQRRAPMPTVPLELFRRRMFLLGTIAGVAFGWVAFGVASFVPLLAQVLTGGTALDAGAALVPMTLGWATAVMVAGPLVLPIGYRRMNLFAFTCLGIGCAGLASVGEGSPLWLVGASSGVTGVGCGVCSVSQLLAIQNTVGSDQLGVATSLTMFFRNIGNAVGVSVMGALQVGRLEQLYGRPIDASASLVGGALEAPLRDALIGSFRDVFVLALAVVAVGLTSAWFMTAYHRDPAATPASPPAGAHGG